MGNLGIKLSLGWVRLVWLLVVTLIRLSCRLNHYIIKWGPEACPHQEGALGLGSTTQPG